GRSSPPTSRGHPGAASWWSTSSACHARATSMRPGLSPDRATSAWRRQKSASSASSRGRQSAVCMTLHKVNLVIYVSSVPVITTGWQARPSAAFENQGEFGACGYPVPGELLVFRSHLALLEDGIAGVIDREQLRVDGVALGVAYALRLLEANLHMTSSAR